MSSSNFSSIVEPKERSRHEFLNVVCSKGLAGTGKCLGPDHGDDTVRKSPFRLGLDRAREASQSH